MERISDSFFLKPINSILALLDRSNGDTQLGLVQRFVFDLRRHNM